MTLTRVAQVAAPRVPAAATAGTAELPTLLGHRVLDATPALSARVAEDEAVASFPHGTVFVFDHDLRYVHVGGAHLIALDRPRTDYVGRTVWEMFDADAAAARVPYYRRALAGDNVVFDAPLNGDRILEMHLSPLLDGSGAVVSVMGYTLDVTDLRAGAQELRDSQEQFRIAFEMAPIGMTLLRLDGTMFQVNPALASLLRVDDKGLLGQTLATVTHPDDRVALREQLSALANGDAEAVEFDTRWRRSDGQVAWVHLTAAVVRLGRQRRPSHVIAQIWDVTQQREQQEAIAAGHAFQAAVLAASPDVIYVRDVVENELVWTSRSLNEMLGYTDEHLASLGSAVADRIIPPEDRTRFEAAAVAAQGVADGEVVQVRHRARHLDDSYRWLSRRLTPFRRDASGAVTHLLGVSRDITDAVMLEQQVEHASLHDELTGLPNRRLITASLVEPGGQPASAGTAVLFCDLDGFKAINDDHGHGVGDAVLVTLAERMRGAVREGDTVGRFGGDEFLVVLPMNPGEDASQVGQRVADRIAHSIAQPVRIGDVEHSVTVSIGLSVTQSGEAVEQLVLQADQAMYRAKQAGKNRTVAFCGELD